MKPNILLGKGQSPGQEELSLNHASEIHGRIFPLGRNCAFLPRVPNPSMVDYWAVAMMLHTLAHFPELFRMCNFSSPTHFLSMLCLNNLGIQR